MRKNPHPDERQQRYAAGLFSWHEGRFSEAVESLADLKDGDDLLARTARYHWAMAHRALGLEALSAGRFDDAERHLRAAVEAAGPSADLSSYLAAVYARSGRIEKCMAEADRAVDLDPASPAARRRRALAEWRAGRRTNAHMTLTEALRRFPSEAGLHVQKGLFLSAEDQYDEAAEAFARAVEADAGCAEAHYYSALAAAARGDAVTAVRGLQRALELEPLKLVWAYQLAVAAKASREQGGHPVLRMPETRPGGERTDLGRLAAYVTAEPDFVDAFLALPATEADAELFGLLAAVLDAAIAENDGYADLHQRQARVLARLGRTDRAAGHARRALAVNPNYIHARLCLSDLLAESDPSAASEELRAAIDAGADWPDIHCRAGELLLRCGRTEEAREHLRRALELKSDYERAAEALASAAA